MDNTKVYCDHRQVRVVDDPDTGVRLMINGVTEELLFAFPKEATEKQIMFALHLANTAYQTGYAHGAIDMAEDLRRVIGMDAEVVYVKEAY